MADKNLSAFDDLPSDMTDADEVHVNRSGHDYKTLGNQLIKKTDVKNDINNTSADKPPAAKVTNDLKRLSNWQNRADGLVFNFTDIWEISRSGTTLTIKTKTGQVMDIDESRKNSFGGQTGSLPDGGGITLEFPVSLTSPFTFVSDISTITEGGDLSVFVVAKNINGLLKSRIPSLQEYFYAGKNAITDLSWDFDTLTTDGDPGSGKFRMNNATPASVTEIYFSKTSKQGIDVSNVLLDISSGAEIQIIQSDDVLNYIIGTVGTVVDDTDYVKVPITITDSGVLFGSGKECSTSLYYETSINIADEIHAASSKTTPVDADEIGLVDSAGAWGLKKLTWTNLKATLKTYFDTLYSAAAGHTIKDAGTAQTNRAGLNFTGFKVSDDAVNDETDVEAQFDKLTDVDISGRANGDLPVYNSISEKMEFEGTTPFDEITHSSDANISANGKLSTILPAGYKINTIIITETSSNAAGNISIGTASAGTQIVNAETVGASADLKATIISDYQSNVNDTDLYVSSSAWGSGVITIYFTFIKV